jgi:retron-type reverse transcriptase
MLLAREPQFDTKILKKSGCWPVTSNHYKAFTIKKRNGSERNLVAVKRNLKELQSNFRRSFESSYEVSKYAHAFVSKTTVDEVEADFKSLRESIRPRGVITNALVHTNKKLVISIDLKDFFPTITFPRVMGMFKKPPYSYSNKQAAIIAELTCLPKGIDTNRGLPQGAPTSPILSNLVCKKLDYQLGKMASKYNLAYSRYADDLTFSTNDLKRIQPQSVIHEVTRHAERNGFTVNEDKTKIMYSNQRQMVTGIVVNDGLNLHKKHVDALRATLHNLEHNYNSVEEAIRQYWKLPNKRSFDAFLPIGFYKSGNLGRFVKSPSKGPKGAKPIDKTELNEIYALHLLGRILWYGQVVTTAIDEPHNLTKHKFISPKQHSRIRKYEEMLASYYRISMKYGWDVEHIVRKLANKHPYLQVLVKMSNNLLLEPVLLNDSEKKLIDDVSKLYKNKDEYKKFFESAPPSLQRVIRVENRSHNNINLEKLKANVEAGWYNPAKQKEVFFELNSESLADLFHKSTNGKGHLVKSLIKDLVKVVGPRLRYLSPVIRKNITTVHRELYALMKLEGEGAIVDFENESLRTKKVLQAVLDLKNSVRLEVTGSMNFYEKIVLPAIKQSGMDNLVFVDKENMALRLVTDILAWRDALSKLLISVNQHLVDSERVFDSRSRTPISILVREANPKTGAPMAIEVYRRDSSQKFKVKLNIKGHEQEGLIEKWVTGGDLSSVVRSFLSLGDLFVHGNYDDASNVTVNLTEHKYLRELALTHDNYGQLFFTLQELNK